MRTLLAFVALLASGCSAYMGSATTLSPQALREEPGWVSVHGVQPLRQKDAHDCGPTALHMVLNYWQPQRTSEVLQELPLDRQASAAELRDAARRRGMSAFVVEGETEDLVRELEAGRPVIVGMAKRTTGNNAVTHYEVVVGMHRGSKRVATYDPAAGVRQNSFSGFLTEWHAAGRVLLVIMPKPATQQPTEQPSIGLRSSTAARAL